MGKKFERMFAIYLWNGEEIHIKAKNIREALGEFFIVNDTMRYIDIKEHLEI